MTIWCSCLRFKNFFSYIFLFPNTALLHFMLFELYIHIVHMLWWFFLSKWGSCDSSTSVATVHLFSMPHRILWWKEIKMYAGGTFMIFLLLMLLQIVLLLTFVCLSTCTHMHMPTWSTPGVELQFRDMHFFNRYFPIVTQRVHVIYTSTSKVCKLPNLLTLSTLGPRKK